MTLRLTPEQDAALALLAMTQGISKHEAAARAIVDNAARLVRTSELRELARAQVPTYRELDEHVRKHK